MKRCRIVLQAEQDLADLSTFIGQDNPTAATGMLDLIERKCALLCRHPEMGRSREDLFPALRSFPVGSYVIFYRVVAEELQILRVLHGSRDVEAEFHD